MATPLKAAPPLPPADVCGSLAFESGDRVEAQYNGSDEWYLATVEVGNGTGAFIISWDDGDDEDRVKHTHELRLVSTEFEPPRRSATREFAEDAVRGVVGASKDWVDWAFRGGAVFATSSGLWRNQGSEDEIRSARNQGSEGTCREACEKNPCGPRRPGGRWFKSCLDDEEDGRSARAGEGSSGSTGSDRPLFPHARGLSDEDAKNPATAPGATTALSRGKVGGVMRLIGELFYLYDINRSRALEDDELGRLNTDIVAFRSRAAAEGGLAEVRPDSMHRVRLHSQGSLPLPYAEFEQQILELLEGLGEHRPLLHEVFLQELVETAGRQYESRVFAFVESQASSQANSPKRWVSSLGGAPTVDAKDLDNKTSVGRPLSIVVEESASMATSNSSFALAMREPSQHSELPQFGSHTANGHAAPLGSLSADEQAQAAELSVRNSQRGAWRSHLLTDLDPAAEQLDMRDAPRTQWRSHMMAGPMLGVTEAPRATWRSHVLGDDQYGLNHEGALQGANSFEPPTAISESCGSSIHSSHPTQSSGSTGSFVPVPSGFTDASPVRIARGNSRLPAPVQAPPEPGEEHLPLQAPPELGESDPGRGSRFQDPRFFSVVATADRGTWRSAVLNPEDIPLDAG